MDSSALLLSPTSGMYFELDEVGTRVWELCDGQRTVGEVVTALCDEFDAPADVIRVDVDELLADLRLEGLLDTGA